jgi:uncharacterized membrane protein
MIKAESIDYLEKAAKNLANRALDHEKRNELSSATLLYAQSAQALKKLAQMTFDPKAMQFYLETAKKYNDRAKLINESLLFSQTLTKRTRFQE